MLGPDLRFPERAGGALYCWAIPLVPNISPPPYFLPDGLNLSSPCSPGWPYSHNSHTSTSWVLRLQVCTTMPSLKCLWFNKVQRPARWIRTFPKRFSNHSAVMSCSVGRSFFLAETARSETPKELFSAGWTGHATAERWPTVRSANTACNWGKWLFCSHQHPSLECALGMDTSPYAPPK